MADDQLAVGDRVTWKPYRRGVVKRLAADNMADIAENEIFGRPVVWRLSRAILTKEK